MTASVGCPGKDMILSKFHPAALVPQPADGGKNHLHLSLILQQTGLWFRSLFSNLEIAVFPTPNRSPNFSIVKSRYFLISLIRSPCIIPSHPLYSEYYRSIKMSIEKSWQRGQKGLETVTFWAYSAPIGNTPFFVPNCQRWDYMIPTEELQ